MIMIKVSDLRIGNLVLRLYASGPEEVKIIELRGGDGARIRHSVLGDSTVANEDEIKGILLTEGRLRGAGFVNLIYSDDTLQFQFEYIKFHLLVIQKVTEGWQPMAESSEGTEPYGRILKYVHELQNWFYILTGNELEIMDVVQGG